MANINDINSIITEYPKIEHKKYIREKNIESEVLEIPIPMICLVNRVDEYGDFSFHHGFFTGKNGDNDSDIYLPIYGDYDSMVRWILSEANGIYRD